MATKLERKVKIGRLADGREAFALLTDVVAATGNYWQVKIWVRNPKKWFGIEEIHRATILGSDDPELAKIFNTVNGVIIRPEQTIPAWISHQLGWIPQASE